MRGGGAAMVRKMLAEMQPSRKIVRVDRTKLWSNCDFVCAG